MNARPTIIPEPLLQVEGVTLQYKTTDHLVTATYRVDFEVMPGDRYILLGPSGCGKSTLLKAIGGYMTRSRARSSSRAARSPNPAPTG